MTEGVADRLDLFELKLLALQRELAEIRTAVQDEAPAPDPPAAAPPPPLVERPPIPTPPRRARIEAPIPPLRPQRERELRPQLDVSKLMSAVSLAAAGGVVTLLGIIFLFVLAVERGWIGPEVRVAFGAAASGLLLGTAVVLHHRFGRLHSALAAAGAGIAGWYATLLAATVLYDLVTPAAALGVAAGIASLGVFLALRWSSQLLAAIGLLGAIAAPAAEALDTGSTTVGTAFAAVMLAAALLVALRRNWTRVARLSALAAGLQGAALVLLERTADPAVVGVAAAFVLILGAAGIAWHLVRPRLTLGALPTTLVLAAGAFAFYSGLLLFDGVAQGVALVVAALGFAGTAAPLFRVRAYRDLSTLVLALALALGAVGAATLLSGGTLTYVWAAEAVVLFWLAQRTVEIRFQLAGLAYLGLSVVHALTNEARPEVLFTITAAPEKAIPSAVALAVACGASAVWVRPRLRAGGGGRGPWRIFSPVLHALAEHQNQLRMALISGSGFFALTGLAIGIVAAFAAAGGSFQVAHAVVSGVWGCAAVATLYTGLVRERRTFVVAGLAWIAVTTAKVLLFDAWHLDGWTRSASFLATALALFASAALVEWFARRGAPLGLAASLSTALGLALALSGVVTVLDGVALGLTLLGIASLYAAGAACFLRRRRSFATLLGAIALSLAAVAAAVLLDGQWLVVAYSAGGAALAWTAVAAGELRLRLGALAWLGLALGVVILDVAPPDVFFHAGAAPGHGVPAVLAVAVAIATSALACGRTCPDTLDTLDKWLDRAQPRARIVGLWAAGAVALYGVSLAILELFEHIRPGTIVSSFQSGHTAVSAAWGLLGLVLLCIGLRRGRRSLQLGGFALFGVSLAKLFLYDLAQLSSITRALSFLAVGGVLLSAGFFYQRLSRGSDRPAAS
jgi:uncharacterized membrane protein